MECGAVDHGRGELGQAVGLGHTLDLEGGGRIAMGRGSAAQIGSNQRAGGLGAGAVEEREEGGVAVGRLGRLGRRPEEPIDEPLDKGARSLEAAAHVPRPVECVAAGREATPAQLVGEGRRPRHQERCLGAAHRVQDVAGLRDARTQRACQVVVAGDRDGCPGR